MEIAILGLFAGTLSGMIFGFFLSPITFLILSIFVTLPVISLLLASGGQKTQIHGLLLFSLFAFHLIGWTLILKLNPESGHWFFSQVLEISRTVWDSSEPIRKFLFR